MPDLTTIPSTVRPLSGAIVRRATAAATLAAGDVVYITAGGGVALANANTLAAASARGLVVADGFGSTSFASGQRVDVVVYGPVAGFAALTPGGAAFVSATNGKLTDTAPIAPGTFISPLGYAESATSVFVQPTSQVPVEN